MQDKTRISNTRNHNLAVINDKINYLNVRVIDTTGQQLGIYSSNAALKLARDENLDLVLVNSKVSPPVCKITNYGKYKFAQEKRARRAKKKQQSTGFKEVKMRYKIEEHDYQVRVNQAIRFLETGNKVKVTVTFRGREIQHLNLAISLLNRMAVDLKEKAEIQSKPHRDSKNLVMFLSAKKSSNI